MSDAVNLEVSLEESEEAQEQIAFADIILLNPTTSVANIVLSLRSID